MKRLEQFKKIKGGILRDALEPITYITDRTQDISAIMKSYLSDQTAAKDKEAILQNLVNCIEGRPYEQPYYTKAHVEKLAGIMDRFIDRLIENCKDGCLPPAKELTDTMWAEITELNEKTDGRLIDTWRWNGIRGWMEDACKASVHTVSETKKSMGGMQML